MSEIQQITRPASAASVKNSAARVAAEKARLSKVQPKASAKARTINRTRTSGVSAQERYEMIAETAYFRAAERDFAPGHETDDWVAAEKEIDRILK